MNTSPTPSENETEADARARRTARQLAVLDALIEVGLELTLVLRDQAKAEVEAAARLNEPAPDFTVAVERMARVVGRTILLSQKISQPVKAEPARDPAAVRRKIIRTVEDSIERDAPAEQAEQLRGEFVERMVRPEMEYDIEARPAEEIIEEIRRDLGIAAGQGNRKWKRRTPADIALLCTRAATPRPAAGPYVLPMPPRRFDYDNPLFSRAEPGAARLGGEAGIRGP